MKTIIIFLLGIGTAYATEVTLDKYQGATPFNVVIGEGTTRILAVSAQTPNGKDVVIKLNADGLVRAHCE